MEIGRKKVWRGVKSIGVRKKKIEKQYFINLKERKI